MKTIYRNSMQLSLTVMLCLTLLACSKITQNNFEKIKPNMSMKDVITLIGEPISSESVNIAGISGTSAVWRDSNAEIDIQFLNDKVAVKTFSKHHEALPKSPSEKPSLPDSSTPTDSDAEDNR